MGCREIMQSARVILYAVPFLVGQHIPTIMRDPSVRAPAPAYYMLPLPAATVLLSSVGR